MNNHPFKFQKAFTLIELLVVIAIIGILAGMVAVNMSGATNAARIAKSKAFSGSIRSSMLMNRVSEWRFDEGSGTATADSLGPSNGILNNFNFTGSSNWKTGADCVSGSCLSFDGSNDFVNFGNDPSLSSPTFTWEMWVYNPKVGVWVFSKNKDDGIPSMEYGFIIQSPGAFFQTYINGANRSTSANTNLATAGWSHIAVVFDGTKIVYYIDGKIFETDNWTGTVTATDASLQFSGRRPGYGSPFGGVLDDFRIYNSPLTSYQIQDHYLAGLNKLVSKGIITENKYNQKLLNFNSPHASSK
ncbi:MAG: LamG-like jellyroll fold domain-containing protein [Candidatus Paceibacterota bacterium]|jgi:prepilin-type N-terminal cleavage/methylation domain-containing protein